MNDPHQQGSSNSSHPDSLSLLQQCYQSMAQANNSQGQANPHLQFLTIPAVSSSRLAMQPQGMNQNCNAAANIAPSSAANQQVLINNNLMRMALAGNLNLTNVLQMMNMAQTQTQQGVNRAIDSVTSGPIFQNETGPTNVTTNSGQWKNNNTNEGNTIQATTNNPNTTHLTNTIPNNHIDLSSISLSNAETFYRQLQQQTGDASVGINSASYFQQEQPEQQPPPAIQTNAVSSEKMLGVPSMATIPLDEEDKKIPATTKTKIDLPPETEQQQLDSSAIQDTCIEAKKGRRVSVVPCRARGMSVKHNFQTAFFEIPESIKHGDPLICSYPDCRNRGVKFLYCSYCKDPVAKRNFRNRHNHGMTEVTETTEGDETHNAAKAPAKVTSGSSSSDGSSAGDNNSGNNQDNGNINKRTAAQALGGELSGDLTIPNKLVRLTRVDPTRVEAWQMLLPTRPSSDDEETMSAWLMRVMAVSDTGRPITEVLANLELVPPRGQKKSYTVPLTTSETEEDTNEESNDTAIRKADGGSSSSPLERAQFSSSNEDSNDSNESNESSSENGHQDANTGYSSETQDPMGSSPTEGSSSDDSNDSSSSENRESRKYSSLSGGSHKYNSQESEESLPDRTASK